MAGAVLQNHELLLQILSNLTSLKDLACCAPVSRKWHAAVQSVQLTSIIFDTKGRELDAASLRSVEMFIKIYKARGTFEHLRKAEFSISSSNEPFQCKMQSYMLRMVLLAVYLLPRNLDPSPASRLTTCSLEGWFSLAILARWLPQTLQHLRLRPGRVSETTWEYLSVFSRFDELQSLEIDVSCFDCRNERHEFYFEINTSMRNLRSLCLLGAHSSILTVSCHICDCLPACLPKLQHIGAAVRPLAAQAMLHLGTLKFAAFDIIVVRQPPCLAVCQSASLETLLFKRCRG